MPTSVALIGAYERDNFGDLLFALVTPRLFAEGATLTAPFPGRVDDLIGNQVVPYGPIFEQSAPDIVWVAGGEVGGQFSPEMAFSMRQPIPGDPGVDSSLPRSEQLRRLAGTEHLEFPYLPRPSAFKGTMTVPYVVNSVGLSQLRTLSRVESAPARAALREADAVSVRDPLSSRLLDEWGIDHRLAPDIVHALRMQHPLATMTSRSAVIQMRSSMIKDLGVRHVAQLLRSIPDDLDIRFIAAGTAPGHDNLKAYYAIAEVLRQVDPSRRITVSETRSPLAVVEEIASAQLFVGTSLHGRIVSAAYDVPRVSLNGEKLNEYAAQWDGAMPFGRDLIQVGEAAAEARQARQAAEGTGARLAALALENARQLQSAVLASNLQDRVVRRAFSVEQLRRETAAPPYVGHIDNLGRHLKNPRAVVRRAKRKIVRKMQRPWN